MAHFLHKMAAYGDLVEVTAMLEDGLDPDERDEAGRTALMYAADGGHVEVMQALLDTGADVNAADEAGQTALMYAIPLGLPPVPKLLIEAGADVNAADEFGKTALHEAVSQNYVITVDLLVTAGADPTREDDLGKSPLAEAEETLERYRAIVRQLKAARRRGQGRRTRAKRETPSAQEPETSGPREIAPSSYVCMCGHQSDFSERTIRAIKAESRKRRAYLADGTANEHVIVFSNGRLESIICSHTTRGAKPAKRVGPTPVSGRTKRTADR